MPVNKTNIWSQIFIIYTRYLIGGAFVYTSISKILGKRFSLVNGENYPIDSAFHYFEVMYQSGIYWQFLGVCQFIAGALLMTQRYAKLGALLFLPIITNIFMITISIDFSYTWIITGSMLLANMLLIIWDWNELRVLINKPIIINKKDKVENHIIWEIIGLILILFTIICKIIYPISNPVFWGGICLVIGLIGLIIWLKNRDKVNNY